MIEIGSLRIDPPLWLAPMAGVTDRDFRLIVRRIGGIGVVTMEFISSKAIVSGNKRTREMMHFSAEERPLSIQIYGSDVATMREAALVVEELGADICDINMGCPANKVLKGCAGAALMGDLKLAESIVRTVRDAITIPLTVKFRLGLDDCRRNYLELGRICEANGVAAVAMHARTARQMFTGEADWSHLARLKETLAIPVIGNGDIKEPEDALRMLAETGCDGVMVGRGATRNPWIFRQIAARLEGSRMGEADPRRPPRPDPRALPHGGRAGALPVRAPQAAQVHRLVHPRPAQRPQAAPGDQPDPRRPDLPRHGRGVPRRDPGRGSRGLMPLRWWSTRSTWTSLRRRPSRLSGGRPRIWGAEFQADGTGGQLHLPVLAGLRRGLVSRRPSRSCRPRGARG